MTPARAPSYCTYFVVRAPRWWLTYEDGVKAVLNEPHVQEGTCTSAIGEPLFARILMGDADLSWSLWVRYDADYPGLTRLWMWPNKSSNLKGFPIQSLTPAARQRRTSSGESRAVSMRIGVCWPRRRICFAT
jgi:hypothetical protein